MLGIGYIKNDGPTSLSKMTTRDHVFLAERLGGTGTALVGFTIQELLLGFALQELIDLGP